MRIYKKKKVGYGWWVSLAGGFNMVISSGPTFQASSTLFRAIEDEFGWSRAMVSGVASFGRFGGALLGPLEGWLCDKFGPGKMVRIGLILGGIGLLLFSKIDNPIQYYITFFILSLGFSIGGFVPSIVSVNLWMNKFKATGMAMVIGGSSLSGLLVPLIIWGITTYGWRPTFFFVGIISIIFAPILSKIIGKKPPKNIEETEINKTKIYKNKDFTVSEAIKTKAFWSLSISHALVNFSVGAMSAHIFLHLTDVNGVNLSPQQSGLVMSLTAISAFSFQILGGTLGDKLNKRLLLPLFILTQGIALVIIMNAENILIACIFSVVWGIGFGSRTPIFHAIRGEYFGKKHFGTISGLSAFPMALSMMISPVIVGLSYDKTGSYESSFLIMISLCIIACVTILFAKNPNNI